MLAVVQTAHAQGRLQARTADGAPAKLELVEEEVRIRIDQQYADTHLRQVYANESKDRLEGQYLLQVGEGARVHGFAYWNGEQKIVGEVFEKETAARIYEEVTGLGRDPGLLEQVGEGAFSFRVFPIEPAERKPVEVELGSWIARGGDVVEYRMPVASDKAVITAEIRDPRKIRTVTSTTHRIETERAGPGHVKVRARATKGKTEELVLRYVVAEKPWQLDAAVHRDPGHDAYLLLTLATPGTLPNRMATPKDVTLVLDRSGSMGGEPLGQAKLAAVDLVSRLGPQDRVNVVAFDDAVETLYDTPKRATSKVREEAVDYIQRINDGGGTDLAAALQAALAAQTTDDQPDVLLFLTDGQSDPQATLKVAEADKGDARVFTIGVGSGVEKPLLSRLAAIKRGRFTYIENAAAITQKMATIADRIAMPVLVDVSLEVEGAKLVRTYPRSLPDLYLADELRIASRVRGTGPAKVALRGKLAGKPMTMTREIQIPKQTKRPWVGRLWAQSRVDDLLEETSLHGETEELKTEIIELALAYNFTTPHTAFLAIPEQELTEEARGAMESAREQKQRILAAHKDAVALSRTAMPPGDPLLTVRAPADARQVTAHFPFGLVKDLTYDADRERWMTRFLVPKEVADGTYVVKVVIVHTDGTTEVARVKYTIDTTDPDFTVTTMETDGGVRVEVETKENARRVTVALASNPQVRVDLVDRGDHRGFEGVLEVPPGSHQLRVVVADKARNESDRLLAVEVAK